jgi:flagellar hook-associated protein 3 FlgL
MRVTTSTYANDLALQLSQITARQSRLQQQAASGQRIQQASDDPVATRRVLDLQAEARRVSQYRSNIARQQELATGSYQSIRAFKKINDRASEIATLADNLKSPQELSIYGREVTELIKQAVQQANTKSHGEYMFGGTKSDVPPFKMTLDSEGRVTSVVYQGNTELAEVEITEGNLLSSQNLGANTTGTGPRGLLTDPRGEADFFGHLITLQNQLLAGDSAAIQSASRAAIVKDGENLLYHIGTNGAIQSRLEATDAVASQRLEAITGRVSKEADADLADTLVKLNQTSTAYQAALQTANKLLSTSLLDYIR